MVRPRVAWQLTFLAFFLLGAAWALALPANGTYDEKQHIVRAYAAADGQLRPDARAHQENFVGTDAFRVPASLIPGDPHCTWYPRPRPASCQHPVTDRHLVIRVSGAARYSPVYYIVVGLPMLLAPDLAGIVAGRLISALCCGLLIATAVRCTVRAGQIRALTGVALAATPLAVNLFGAINPNGLEIAAAVLLFSAGTVLARGEGLDRAESRRLALFAGLAVLLLCAGRLLGPLVAAVDLAACVALAPPARRRELLHRRELRWIAAAGALGLTYYVAWLAFAGTDLAGAVTHPPRHSRRWLAGEILTHRIPFYAQQAVAQFGYGETHISPVAVILWYALVAALVLPALRYGDRRLRYTVLFLLGTTLVLLVGLDAWFARSLGWVAQGRYGLPIALGAILIGAGVNTPAPSLLRYIPAVVASIHLYALATVLTRYRTGRTTPLDPFTGAWQPLFGPVPALVAALAGALLLAWCAAAPAVRWPRRTGAVSTRRGRWRPAYRLRMSR